MAFPLTTETPLYTLLQSRKRALMPKAVALIGLGIIFYLGILLNISFLQLNAAQETMVQLVALLVLLSIIILGVYQEHHQVKQPYNFYKEHLIIGKKEVDYHGIAEVARKQNWLDKWFKTYYLDLGNKQVLKNIPAEVDVESYLKQLVEYVKRS